MNSGVPWNLRGVPPELLDSAREAARRSGMSVEEWLDTVIAESARHAGIDPNVHQLSDFDQRGPYRESSDTRSWRQDEPARRESSFADVSARLDELARQVDHLSSASGSRMPERHPAMGNDNSAAIADVLARLDRKIDRLSAMGSAAPYDYAPAAAPSLAPSAAPEGSIDQALAEIGARQRMLDGSGTVAAPMELPRAPTQRLPDLEQQLRQINTRIDQMRPCGIDAAVETLRDDLAEIGMMLKEAMPRQAIEALEAEIRSLAARVDNERHAGADGAMMAGVERGLAEVRDALRALTPAENLAGIDQALHGLSQKIDRVASTTQDPDALKQLEGAIVALRGVVSHVASNDALTQLSEEVRMLSTRVDHVTSSDAFSLMEQRIAAIADALEQSRGVPVGDTAGLETVVRGLADKVDQLHASHPDPTAVNYLEDRIVRLVEKLDASDARFDNLGAIERGLADLLIQMEGQRMTGGRGGTDSAETDAIKRDMQRTQDSLETVHGTLGHVVDRLATIEAGMRDGAPPPAASSEPADRRAQVPAPLEPSLPGLLQSPPVAPTQSAMFREAPADEAPSAPRANPSPALERRPIDPDLPPDHPLEPGAGRGRSPADRIAASEAALENVRPPVIPDPAGKSNFIAAARRAAQAAIVEAPPAKDKRAADPATEGEADKSLASKITGVARKLVVGVCALVFVLGAVHFVTTRYWNRTTPTAEPPTTQATHQERVPEAEPPAVSAPAPTQRQSTALPPGITISPNGFGIGVPSMTPAGASADGDTTGSIRQPALQAAVTPVPAILPAAPAAAPARGDTPADRLPPAIAGGLRAAAANGDAAAEFEIASRFADGRGVPQNLPEAAAWFERAANQGLAQAQFRLGGLYEKGMGVQKNLETARRLYVAAAEAGHAKAMHNLAVLYAEGIEGKPNYATAARWFRKAADYGVVDSQYNLAILYARGIGVEANLTESFMWFALASREGDRDAAKKRDDLATRLDKQALAAAMAAAQTWQPQRQPDAAIQVRVPPGGWDAAPAPAAAKRTVGPKAEKQSKRPTQ
jgi:localization factor PodJL